MTLSIAAAISEAIDAHDAIVGANVNRSRRLGHVRECCGVRREVAILSGGAIPVPNG